MDRQAKEEGYIILYIALYFVQRYTMDNFGFLVSVWEVVTAKTSSSIKFKTLFSKKKGGKYV